MRGASLCRQHAPCAARPGSRRVPPAHDGQMLKRRRGDCEWWLQAEPRSEAASQSRRRSDPDARNWQRPGNLSPMVGAIGFEPPTFWSRTRVRPSLQAFAPVCRMHFALGFSSRFQRLPADPAPHHLAGHCHASLRGKGKKKARSDKSSVDRPPPSRLCTPPTSPKCRAGSLGSPI